MDAGKFLDILEDLGGAFYTGVPDSLLSPFIDAIVDRYGIGDRHIVAANEGAAVGLAAGHYLATAQPAIVYMQNSGIGNAVNPICSLLHEKVYNMPVIFVIGWRGEPGVKDEPQHIFQGELTLPLLDCLEIAYTVISEDTEAINISSAKASIKSGHSVAFVIRKGALAYGKKIDYAANTNAVMSREEAAETILGVTDGVYVCTTGKLSREVFEIRERQGGGHGRDFLTVGSMGHSLMIAHGIALAQPDRRVYCVDGDGAALMHMGSMAVVGAHSPKNLVHIVINNGAHETVGGLTAVSSRLNLSETARTLGYAQSFRVASQTGLADVLRQEADGLVFVEVMCNLHSRADLGRPTATPIENRDELMAYLAEIGE